MELGGYEILGTLGRGGYGTVYRARGRDGREVALKLLLRPSPEAAERFERERRLLAGVGEGFVPLLGSGTTPSGPFIVMPLVAGGTLRDRMRSGPLPVDDVRALGRSLAAALGRAHALGIVHRDLKPENVLFTREGEALIADLGLAKHFRGSGPGSTSSLSLSGEARGTVGYMAPEQMGDAKSVGPPADVFALGVVLYECLAAVAPFEGATVLDVAAATATGTHRPLRERRPEVPRWLAKAIERAITPASGSRFEDGAAFARALEGRPRRSLLVPILVTAGIASLIGARAATRRHEVAPVVSATGPDLAARAVAVRAPRFLRPLERARIEVEVENTGAVTWTRAGQWKLGAGEGFDTADDRAFLVRAAPDPGRVWLPEGTPPIPPGRRFVFAFDVVAPPEEGLRELRFRMLQEGVAWFGETARATIDVRHSRDLIRTFERTERTTLREVLGDYPLSHAGAILAAALSEDGKRAVTAGADGIVRVWATDEPRELHAMRGHDGQVLAVAIDGDTVATGGPDIRLWDLATGAARATIPGPAPVGALAFAGRTLLAGDDQGLLRVLTLADVTRAPSWRVLDGSITSIAPLPGGRALVAGLDRDVRIFDLERGAEVGRLSGHADGVLAVAVRDGTVFTAGRDNTVRLWDLETRREGHAFTDAEAGVGIWGVQPLGKRRALAVRYGVLRTWDLDAAVPPRPLHVPALAPALAVSRDGRLALTGDALGGGLLWRVGEDGPTDVPHRGHLGAVLALAPHGRRLLTGGADATLRLWEDGRARIVAEAETPFVTVAFAPDGRRALASGWAPRLIDLEGGPERQLEVTAPAGALSSVAFARDGKRAIGGTGEGSVRIFDVGSGKNVATFRSEASMPRYGAVVFSDDGAVAWSGGDDHVLREWDVARGVETRAMATRAPVRVLSGAGSIQPETARRQSDAVVVDALGKELARIPARKGSRVPYAIAPRARLAFAGSLLSNEVVVWDLASGREARRLRHADLVTAIAATPDASLVATGSADGNVLLWEPARRPPLVDTIDLRSSGDHATSLFLDAKTLWVGTKRGVVLIFDLG